MEKHDCYHLLSSFSDFIDGDLNDELCIQLQQHLTECKNCQIVVDTLNKTVSLYHSMSESPIIPTDVRQRLYKCLDLTDYIEKT